MIKKHLRILALVMALCLLLTGCAPLSLLQDFASYYSATSTSFRDMEYVHPDTEKLESTLKTCLQLSQTSQDVDELVESIYDFYAEYDLFYTSYALADIHYNCDITDEYWKSEYIFCTEVEPTAESMLEQLYCALADSHLRSELETDDLFGAGFFADYEEDPVMDKPLIKLMEQEASLENRYYDIARTDGGVHLLGHPRRGLGLLGE